MEIGPGEGGEVFVLSSPARQTLTQRVHQLWDQRLLLRGGGEERERERGRVGCERMEKKEKGRGLRGHLCTILQNCPCLSSIVESTQELSNVKY